MVAGGTPAVDMVQVGSGDTRALICTRPAIRWRRLLRTVPCDGTGEEAEARDVYERALREALPDGATRAVLITRDGPAVAALPHSQSRRWPRVHGLMTHPVAPEGASMPSKSKQLKPIPAAVRLKTADGHLRRPPPGVDVGRLTRELAVIAAVAQLQGEDPLEAMRKRVIKPLSAQGEAAAQCIRERKYADGTAMTDAQLIARSILDVAEAIRELTTATRKVTNRGAGCSSLLD